MDAASKREMSILRRLAHGLLKIGRKIMAMNAVWLTEQEVVRLTNGPFGFIGFFFQQSHPSPEYLVSLWLLQLSHPLQFWAC